MAWPGAKYETNLNKNVGLHKTRGATGFWSQNTKSSVNDVLKPGNEKAPFYKKKNGKFGWESDLRFEYNNNIIVE